MSELRECPFCGGEAHVVQNDYPTPFGAHDVLFAVECTVRGCYAKTTEWYPKSSAVRAWNTRPTDDRVSKLVEAAKAVVERWDSPSWKDVPHTANYIHALREALEIL